MRLCVPVTIDGQIDPRWGCADRVAIAEVNDGRVVQWEEQDVSWSRLHDTGTEGSHHARVARFLQEHAGRPGRQWVISAHGSETTIRPPSSWLR